LKISEYPSSSTCICAAHAHAIRKFRNSDELNLKVTFPKGSSGVEPGKLTVSLSVFKFRY
jgi:hypothetical protein